MNEQQVRAIIADEIQKNLFKLPKVPPTYHTGVDNVKIPSSSIVANTASYGFVYFNENQTYTLNFAAGNPSLILVNGLVYNTSNSDEYALIEGNAVITKTMAFQPNTTSSVVVGGPPYPITDSVGRGVLAQCSTNLYIVGGTGGTANGHVDDNFIVNAYQGPGLTNHVATAQFMNIQPSSVDLVVTNLLSGWELKLNFTII